MAQIRIRGNIETLFKLRNLALISLFVDFILTTSYGSSFLPNTSQTVKNLLTFFANPNLLTFYGTVIGLLMAAYTVMITILMLQAEK